MLLLACIDVFQVPICCNCPWILTGVGVQSCALSVGVKSMHKYLHVGARNVHVPHSGTECGT